MIQKVSVSKEQSREITRLSDENLKLEEELGEAEAKVKALEEQNTALKTQNRTITTDFDSLTVENGVLSSRVKELEEAENMNRSLKIFLGIVINNRNYNDSDDGIETWDVSLTRNQWDAIEKLSEEGE